VTARPLRCFAVAAALPMAFTACSSGSSSRRATPLPPTPTGTLTVFAAASLTGAFTAAKSTLASADPRLALTLDFAGSNTLATQIEQGAPTDVFASADQVNMAKLVSAGLVEPPVTFARNKLEIAVAPGNPKHIASLQDLARAGITVVLEEPGVPAGDYTRQVEGRLGITITPESLAPDVKTAITAVGSGEADATVVYVTDVAAAGSKVAGVPVPDALQPAITYPIAVVKATHNQAAAGAFVQSAVSGDVHDALLAQGFLAP
jgi:molybdate transport system substrate-binding protein